MRTETRVSGKLKTHGALLGDITHLKPFIYLARIGGRGRADNPETATSGVYSLGTPCGEGSLVHEGLIFPIRQCQDPALKAKLLDLTDWLAKAQAAGNRLSARTVRRTLRARVGRRLEAAPSTETRDYLSLNIGTPVLELLRDYFEYVDTVTDDPQGSVTVEKLVAAPWSSEGEFLEWFYAPVASTTRSWERCRPYLVWGQTDALNFTAWRAGRIDPLALDLPRHLLKRLELPVEKADVQLRVWRDNPFRDTEYYYFDIRIGMHTYSMYISDCWIPFDSLGAWLRMIEDGEAQGSVTFDEEGPMSTFDFYHTADARIGLVHVHGDRGDISGFVERRQLVEAFRMAIREFVWRLRPEKSGWHDFEQIRGQMLKDPWLQRM